MRITLTVLIALSLGAAADTRWARVGDPQETAVDPSGITLNAPKDSVAGIVSGNFEITGDAIIVQAKVKDAPLRGITFALHDSATGESVGYWQNPLGIIGEVEVDAILPLSQKAKTGRLFAGTDRIASNARITAITYRPTKRRQAMHASAYGALVDSTHIAGQTFVTSGTKLDAIVFRGRQLTNTDGPDMIVRVFKWTSDTGKTGGAIAQRIVPRKQLPQPLDGFEVDFPLTLNVATKKGETYFIEWSMAGPCSADQAILLYAGDSSYAGGCRYENGNAVKDWDMYLETFESD